jgi:hypothetical protein
MIELWMRPLQAKGLTPGQPLKIHMEDGSVWIVTRFGTECIVRCTEEKK